MKIKEKLSWVGTGVFTIIGIVYIAPILIVLMNSFKKKVFINKEPFALPTEKTYVGFENYFAAIDKYELLSAVGWTVFITIGSVLVILVCTAISSFPPRTAPTAAGTDSNFSPGFRHLNQ